MNEIKHTPGPLLTDDQVVEKLRGIADEATLDGWRYAVIEAGRDLIEASGANDMADILEIIAADADAGTIMLTSGVRLAIDAALIKAGRKKAPEPVRHFTINGGV
ncbi:hypothetical protein L0Z13_11730 [Burkholderia multivorans]|uniref:hypothetical protein n=1 Tax=Burkholderia multivorans TaxID=87883 RepID=UPI0009E0D118|nr:hypothetical protein [Burkholderia multivorans]MCO1435423.1 hypothetical protein [Burkholderia multivorans]MDN7511976.1 hypothetical protein [Burkholderia multivorans]UQN62162.1 hypothetical protein L0Y94_21575 [Burkholderia multivorans]UQN67755.1 hypothetical protein L0Y92_19780 [Burkholderia multivorans]UQO07997.1 hypothetical protein L0Z13_11405 [Burkholderia multivorans]